MTWTLVGVGSPVEVASGSVTAALPAGTQAGDLLIADIGYRDQPPFSAPSGWEIVAQINDPYDTRTDVFADACVAQAYCIRGASAPELTFIRSGGDAAVVQVRAYRATGSVAFGTFITHNTGAVRQTALNIGAITTAADSALIVVTVPMAQATNAITALNAVDPGAGTDGTPDTASAPGSTWRTRFASYTTLGNAVGLYGFDAVKASAGSTGTISYTQTTLTSGEAIVSAFFSTAVAPTITGITASNLTQTGARITATRSNPAAGTLYLVIVPQGVTPTWSRANIATNSGWTATTIAYHDADTDPGTGATYQFVPDASGLTAGTSYDLWAVWDDGTTTVGPVQGTGFETASAAANLVIQDAAHAHTADATTLSAQLALSIDAALHSHTADNLALAAGLSLATDNAAHAHSAEHVTLSAAVTLAVQNASHLHIAAGPALSAALNLVVQDTLHAHGADNLTLVASDSANLAIADAAHSHFAEALALSAAHSLVVQDSAHGHTAQALALSAALNLLVDAAIHAHTAESVTLDTSAASNLTIASSSHAHLADALTLSGALSLVVDGSSHAHSVMSPTLSAAHSLVVQNAAHAHLADTLSLNTGFALTIANAFHTHVADGLSLDTALALAIDAALHTHQAEAVTLTAALTLIVADTLHEHLASNVGIYIPTPTADLLRRSVFVRLAQHHSFVRVEDPGVFVRLP